MFRSGTVGIGRTSNVKFAFQCPRGACLHLFIARYEGRYEPRGGKWNYQLRSLLPFTPVPPSHPADVNTLSPQFVEIFRQAGVAEGFGLSEIAGVGYRKSLEFLVKDYCIDVEPANKEKIKAKQLGQVISDHIPDDNIKGCARRATWLGNDETHYVRRWTDKDITDLKALISLTESWINTHLLTSKYLRDMPDA